MFTSILSISLASVLLIKQGESDWHTYEDLHIDPACTSAEYYSNLGVTATAEDCFTAASALYPNINYAVWRGDYDNRCHTCDISGRTSYEYFELSGLTSFTYLDSM